jgi:LCP family protein required for cell wall assembly
VITLVFVAGAICATTYLVWGYFSLSGQINNASVLSNRTNNSVGVETFLIVGSDGRSEDAQTDVLGERSDTIMVLIHSNSDDYLISLPRDTKVLLPEFVDEQHIFGIKSETIDPFNAKLNAAFAYGGPQLLVRTVEDFLDLKIDHYIQVGFDSVEAITDAVGAINLCLDYAVSDPDSKLVWTPGCHDVDGFGALAFSRMRYADPLGDIGRTLRQHQVVAQLSAKIGQLVEDTVTIGKWPGSLFGVTKLYDIGEVVAQHTTVDQNMTVADFLRLLGYFRNAAQHSDEADNQLPFDEDDYLDMDPVLGSVVVLDKVQVRNWVNQRTQ